MLRVARRTEEPKGSSEAFPSSLSFQETFPGGEKTDRSIHCVRAHSFSFSLWNVYICMFACVYVHMPEEAQGEVRDLPQSPFPSFSEAGSRSQTQSLWMWLVSPASLFWGSLSLLSKAGSTCSLHTHRHLHKSWGSRQAL